MSTSTSTTPQSNPAVQPSTLPHGRFVWYDLMTTDVDAAKKFYGGVVGWSTQPWGDQGYTLWVNGDAPIGGVMKLDDESLANGIPPHWLGSVCVRNVDESVAQAQSLGGRLVHGPEDIPMVGRFAIITDPQGVIIALFTPANEAPGSADPGRGEFSWHELATTDFRAAFAFYSAMFGWESMSEMDMGPDGMYLMYGQNGRMYGGMYNVSAQMQMPPSWTYYAMVEDVDAAVERVKELGGQVMVGPMEVPGGDRIAVFADPQGAASAVHARKK